MRDTIEFVLMYEDNLKRAIEEKKADMALPETGGSSGNARRSDPTCQKAIRNLSSVGTVLVEYGAKFNGVGSLRAIHEPEKWLRVADATWAYFKGTKQGLVMRYRYKKGYTRAEDLSRILKLSRRYVFYLQADIYEFAERTAKGLGIPDVKPHPRLDEVLRKLKGGSE